MSGPVKVLFASGSNEIVPAAIEVLRALRPDLPLIVVSEFPPEKVQWIPFHVVRSFGENLSFIRWKLRQNEIGLAVAILPLRRYYRRLLLAAVLFAPGKLLIFDPDFGPSPFSARSLAKLIPYTFWRARRFLNRQLKRPGPTYTFFWRLIHPSHLRRPLDALLARMAGLAMTVMKAVLPSRALTLDNRPRPAGISVVIPSRTGRELLQALLPEVVAQIDAIGGEIILVDNGSEDDTAEFIRRNYAGVLLEQRTQPLSFAQAVNMGIHSARFSHVCLLNNDMVIAKNFFAELLSAFDLVPDLFCATAQIFFPEGVRREETGKAVIPFSSDRGPADFPVRCDPPVPGENLTYVVYGSGGCSLFEARKLMALGGVDEVYSPAYVEDLDLGFRGWQLGWPSVFVAGAQVVHRHRATTSRYYSETDLAFILELHLMRFVVRVIADPGTFRRMWRETIWRLNLLSARPVPDQTASMSLSRGWRAIHWFRSAPARVLSDDHILSLGSGYVAVTPGRPRSDKPVILIASPYVPFPLAHGGAVRMFNLMRRVADDFDLILVSYAADLGSVPAELKAICREVVQVKRLGTHRPPSTDRPDAIEQFDTPAFRAALTQTMRKWKPSIVQLDFTQMAQYAPLCSSAKTILVEHDVTFDLYEQLLAQADDWEIRRQFKRWVPFETKAWNQVDRIVTMSGKDRALLLERGVAPSKVKCLPNGVDLERYRPSGITADARRMLFIGSFAHLPNVLAMEFFLNEVWPKLKPQGATLHIIAGLRPEYYLDHYQKPLDLTQPGLELQDFVSDVRPAYERAAIVLAPLLASAGTNIKIIEAMAMGKAIVSTPAGINGLDLEPGTDVMVASDAKGMAETIAELFKNNVQRERLERQARRTAEAKYGWDAIALEQAALYRELQS